VVDRGKQSSQSSLTKKPSSFAKEGDSLLLDQVKDLFVRGKSSRPQEVMKRLKACI